MEERILEFILKYAEGQKIVPFSRVEEEFNIVMDDKLKSIIADAIWDIDIVSDAFVEDDGFVITFLKSISSDRQNRFAVATL